MSNDSLSIQYGPVSGDKEVFATAPAPSFVHSAECFRAQDAAHAYLKAHPNRCGTCYGRGLIDDGDGVTWGGFVPCWHCIAPTTGRARCPQCGQVHEQADALLEDMSDTFEQLVAACPTCGWVFGNEGQPLVDCSCWEINQDEPDPEDPLLIPPVEGEQVSWDVEGGHSYQRPVRGRD